MKGEATDLWPHTQKILLTGLVEFQRKINPRFISNTYCLQKRSCGKQKFLFLLFFFLSLQVEPMCSHLLFPLFLLHASNIKSNKNRKQFHQTGRIFSKHSCFSIILLSSNHTYSVIGLRYSWISVVFLIKI